MPEASVPATISADKPKFVLETDEAPEFWQFLNGLRGDDLLVELIVNELDAHSPKTEIRFEKDRLICAGAGDPVDADGWKRLRMLKGAGNKVPAKQGLFGVKNHGLKACFTLGNDIVVRSAGSQILQTLFADGPDQPAYPGVRVPPQHDPDAPVVGTTIEVPYRSAAFRAPQGEAIEFPAPDDGAIEARFREAAKTLPRRLLGIIRPVVLETYTLRLVHHCLGSVTMEYRCGRWVTKRGLLTFSRHCRVLATEGIDATSTFERAALLGFQLDRESERPVFFRAERYRSRTGRNLLGSTGLVLEVSWPVDKAGDLTLELGKLRYPVAYPANSNEARSGLGMSFSAPFASDAQRHEPGAQSKAWNSLLIEACDKLACRALTEVVLPKYGSAGLALISGAEDRERLAGMVADLIRTRSLPAVNHDGRSVSVRKGDRLVIPAYTWDKATWSKSLAAVCPSGSPILDPRTPAPIVALLSEGKCAGWGGDYLLFDERDVLQRMKCEPAKHFPWPTEAAQRTALSDARCAAYHLDAIEPLLARASPATRPKPEGVILPDGQGALHPAATLKRGVSLPAGLLDVDLPPVLHPLLKDHKVFRFEGWKREAFGLGDLLRTGEIAELSIAGRRRFFFWLAQNLDDVARDDWPVVKQLPIWPSTSGEVVAFEQLCIPKSNRLAALLREQLLRPAREARRLCSKAGSKRVRLNLRTKPSPTEVSNFFRARMAQFQRDVPLSDADRERFKAFESELLLFGVEGRLAGVLRELADEAVALSGAGVLAHLDTMVRPSLEIERLGLLPQMKLDRDVVALDRIFPPLRRPTWQMVATSLRQDPENAVALIPRLQAIVAGTTDPEERRSVEDIPCIPVDGKFLAPHDIAFKGNAGDYWGSWKTVIGASGLPDDVQDLYRAVGVIRSFPEPRSSRTFFSWLSKQPRSVIAEHAPQVIRHIAHKNGVRAWRLTPPEIPCLPVEDKEGVKLLTISQAAKCSFIDDFPELAAEIRSASYPFGVAIHSVRQSTTPVAEELREFGIPSLRETARGALSATRVTEAEAPPELQALLVGLQSDATARRLRKQLQELDVPLGLLEARWQNKLAAVQTVRVGTELRAEYRIGRRAFYPKAKWAVLLSQKELWLDASHDLHNSFFGAVSDLILIERRPRYMPAVLKAALEAEVREFQRAADDRAGREPDDDMSSRDAEDAISESVIPHPGGPLGPAHNKPKPGPLYVGASGNMGKPSGASSGRPQVADEEVQRHELKEKHYAWHCQIALAHSSPEVLAPQGSYVEYQENREGVVQAHHPDKVSAGGLRNAGNMLILSRLNHERFGKAVSRQQVTDALLRACEERKILAADGGLWVEGVVARVSIPATGGEVSIFFTHHHRRYWLEMAGHKVPPSPDGATLATLG